MRAGSEIELQHVQLLAMGRTLLFGSAHLPAGWVVNASVNLVGPADTSLPGGRHAARAVYPNVNVTVAEHENPEASAGAVAAQRAAQLQQSLPRFRLIEEGQLPRAGGSDS